MIRDSKVLEAYVSDLLDSMPDASFMVDSTGGIVLVNALAEKMFGYEKQELRGKSIGVLIPERFRGAHAGHCSDYFTRPRSRAMGAGLSLRALRKDGAEFPVEISLSPIETDRGVFVLGAIRDIGQSEARYRAIFEQVAVGVVHSNLEGRFLNVNPKFCEISGYTREEALALDIRALTHPDDIGKSIEARERTLAGTSSAYEREARLVRKGGAAIWAHITTSLVRGADGRALHFISLIHDISPQKQAEEARRESERRFNNLLQHVELAAMMLDRDACVTYCNDYLLRLIGWTREEVIGKNWFELCLPPENRKESEDAFASLLVNQPDALHYENEILTRSRERRLMRWNNTILRSPSGAVIGTASIGEDITERTRAEAALQVSEERFRSLTEMSSDFYWESDAGHRLTRRGSADKKVSAVSVFHQGAQVGQRRWDIPYLSPDAAGWAAHRAVLDTHEPFREFELSRFGADGSERHISISGDPVFDESGAFKGYRGVGKDITERVRRIDDLRRLRAAMDSTADAIYLVDRTSMRFIYVNDAACRMQSCTREELLALGPEGLLSDSRAELEHVYDSIIAGGAGTEPLEMPRQRKDGSRVWIELRRRAQRSSEGWMIVTVVRDVTERKEAEDRIRRLNRVYAVLSGINTLIVRVGDRDELFKEACRIAVEIGHFKMAWIGIADWSAMKIVPIASAGAEPEFLALIQDRFSLRQDAPDGNTMSARAVREKKAVVSNDIREDPKIFFGKERIERGISSIAVLPLLVSDEAAGVLVLYAGEIGFFDEEEMKLLNELAGDISFALDHIEKAKRLNYLAYYDELTGLANRTLFLERVAQYMRSATGGGYQLAVALIDLERFKNINDSLGRPAGDALLRQVAEWMTHITGDTNLLARVGADLFAGVLPRVKQGGDVTRLLEKTMAAFREHPFRLNGAVFRIAAKVGVALFPGDSADADALFRNAEAALKRAKASGDRYVFYTQKMTEAVAGKLTLENQLRQALDNEEFVLHYQPKVNLASGKLTGAEALIRWNDPRTGLVPPGRFIPILEETGLIYEVGRWALRQAIADYLRWRAAGLPAVRIAVNVSPLQLRNRGFVAEVEQAIGIDAQAPAGLELEITESLIMEDVKHNIASLQAVRALGVTIAIDDFGTGFSSLSYLAKLPVDTLKIDRSFVIDMTAGPEGLALVSTIINLAHSLKLKVVAEGVETEEQSHLLRLFACDEMQGFLFSNSVPADIFETRFLVPPPIG